MVNAQEWFKDWLKSRHRNSRGTRSKVVTDSSIDFSNKDLDFSLQLSLDKFPNLKELDCSNNQITKIKFVSPIRDSKKRLKIEWKLEKLNLANNRFEQDLSFLENFTELEELNLANNKFTGSLEPLKNLTKLKKLDISDTDVSEGSEYLPESLEEIRCSSEIRGEAKVKDFAQELEKYKIGETDNDIWLVDMKKPELELAKKLCRAAENNNVEKVKELLSKNGDIIDLQDERGNTALHCATSNGNIEIVKVLLEVEANVNVKGNHGFTPLHIAVAQVHFDIIIELLQAEADPGLKDDEGNTPMHFAAEKNNLKLLQLLKRYGGDINAVNKYGWSVLHSAASGIVNEETEDWEVIKWLLQQEGIDTEVLAENDITIRKVFSRENYLLAEEYDKLLADSKNNAAQQLYLTKRS